MKKAYVATIVSLVLAGHPVEEVLTKLKTVMAKRGHAKLYVQVLRAAERELAVKLVRATPTVTVAKTGALGEAEIVTALEAVGAQGESRVAIDPSIIGGHIVKYRDQLLDKSYKRYLLNLYQKLTNN
jgi:F0F1-type ATP synthase delta subunit